MTISKSWFSYLTRAFALFLCTALLLNFVSCSDSTTSQEPKVKIVLDANGGSFSKTTEKTETTQTLLIKKNQASKLSTADELGLSYANHEFKGWAKSQQGTVEFDDGADITSSTDLTLYAQWEAVNTTYTVKHLLQNLQDDSYTEDEEATEQKSGTYGTETTAAAKTYEGFTAKSFTQATIQADGTTVIEIYYDRKTYTVSYSSTYGEPPVSKVVKYGYVITAADLPDLTQTNYSFKGWLFDGDSIEAGFTVKKDITLTAQWDEIIATYTVKHLLQNLQDDNYTEDEEATEQKTGKSGTQTAAAAKTYEGFTANTFAQETINDDGSTVVEIKYDRKTYTISYSSTYGEPPVSKTVRYGYVLTAADLPDLTQANYSFKGWLLDSASIAAGYTVKKTITLTAQWDEIIATYTVKHLRQNLQNDSYTEDSTEQKSGKSGTKTSAAAKSYEGFTAKSFAQATIQADGTTVVEIYYDRKTYTVSYSSEYGDAPASKPVKYGYVLTAADLPVLTQKYYSFKGWLLDGTSITAGYTVKKDITLTAQWEVAASTYFVTKENISEVIAELTEDSTIVLTGELTDSDLTTIAKAIKNSTYKVNLDLSQTTELTSIPTATFKDCSKLSGITIPDSVTSIDSNTFSGCAALSSVTIPDSVTSIGERAFGSCSSLSSVTIPDSVTSIRDYAFAACTSLSSVTIPDSVTSIGYEAFARCTALSSVTIPDSVTYISYHAFHDCTSLENINVDSNNANYSSIDGVLFNKDATDISTYPAGKQSAAYTIPDSVTSIHMYAFYGCSALSSVTIPDSVTSIGERAFGSCSSLSSVTIPDSVTSIGIYAFYGCTSLSSVTIPDSVTSIGDNAFRACTSLSSVTIGASVTSIGGHAFDGCTSLSSVTIPDSVTSIGQYAFYECSKLTSISFIDPTTWYKTRSQANWNNKTDGKLTYVSDATANATYFTDEFYWYKL